MSLVDKKANPQAGHDKSDWRVPLNSLSTMHSQFSDPGFGSETMNKMNVLSNKKP